MITNRRIATFIVLITMQPLTAAWYTNKPGIGSIAIAGGTMLAATAIANYLIKRAAGQDIKATTREKVLLAAGILTGTTAVVLGAVLLHQERPTLIPQLNAELPSTPTPILPPAPIHTPTLVPPTPPTPEPVLPRESRYEHYMRLAQTAGRVIGTVQALRFVAGTIETVAFGTNYINSFSVLGLCRF